MFHEIDQDQIDRRARHGHHRRDHGRAPTTRAARCCARSASRSRRPDKWPRRRWIAKAARKPKFEVRGYTRCTALRPAARGLPQVRPVPDLLPRDGPRAASCPASPSPAGNRLTNAEGPNRARRRRPGNRGEKGHNRHDNDRPDRRHADASAQRQLGVPRHRVDAALARSRRTSRRSSSRRATSPAWTCRGRRGEVGKTPDRHCSSTARTASARSPASSGCPSPACGSTRRRPTCPRCSAASASRSSRRRPVC